MKKTHRNRDIVILLDPLVEGDVLHAAAVHLVALVHVRQEGVAGGEQLGAQVGVLHEFVQLGVLEWD